ncbi:MAG: endonuclease/exonuclease/phosphatase family protein [Candidatus Marinimicrobia bacterium]|jgi:endonuclease/exonuclease/phosphatase family metal-dependent hydrolase|nr:endonuclease/exonuclease/phosphatase family protein [Candidatus Neomarinimicrobiota bacterium]MBT3840158.1 endonuclease/exonuclease/phosphatase family protein [Candidatus Neomarinimicrobiota bacterium]MBT3999152.1 endonuclease/exonuclease/phosphatase family protein [Candidatus Neomarinimicrobiota bacterium]MBT4282588.1 endonuclease/exonuclease/phosphatase family protein [Candidatus Neomarinimicrobiota bacterium]MBT4579684.1 endonuclease/exonuclease/phosphatase family protein [Candidatus Neom
MINKTFTFLVLTLTLSFGQDISLMTYNIRFDSRSDGENIWENRKETLVNQIRFHEPDVMGTQEGLEHQIQFIDEKLKSYSYVGIARADVKEGGKGEYSAIFYNTKKFTEIKNGTFWLSKTPDIPSRGWDASLNRICTYILLKSKSNGEQFWVFNTHFDHKGKLARENSAKLILEIINEINQQHFPAFLMGDFNLKPDETPIQHILNEFYDSRDLTQEPPFGPVGTFNGFDINRPVINRIDYIFVNDKNIQIKKYGALANVKDLKYPSDHFPIIINVELK